MDLNKDYAEGASVPPCVARYRSRFRQQQIGPRYLGWLHLGFTVSVCAVVIGACLAQLDQLRPLEWLTLPVTFLYANLVEYFGHRGPMHHPRRGLRLVFERHAGQHHRFFRDDAMAFEHSADFKAVLFPPVLIVFYLAVFALPTGLAVAWLFSDNTALLFVIMAVAYFLNYELLHFAYHSAPGSKLAGLPLIRRLGRLHTFHHRPDLMHHYNFNITYPLGDYLFGTLYRGAQKPATTPVADGGMSRNTR
ncbi:MAG: sterol desaturase family protein [Gammaproteobacteria bacterium]